MRKKIFLIHGTGVRRGLGRESGGDLDTVSSNAFYGVWMEKLVSSNGQSGVEYEDDYEFDFINYQEGLQHLDVHAGCDLYLPDFPIDAMAPRLQMHRLRRREAADERSRLYRAVNQIRRAFNGKPDRFPDSWKTIHNALLKQSGKYLKEKKFYEIYVARLYTELLFANVRLLYNEGTSPVLDRIADFLFGKYFNELKQNLTDQLETELKSNLVDSIDQQYVDKRLLVDDASRSDYGRMYRLRDSEHLLGSIVESLSAVIGTYFLLPEIDDVIGRDDRDNLVRWCESLTGTQEQYFGKFQELLDKILEANPENNDLELMSDRCTALKQFFNQFSYEYLMNDYNPEKNLFQVHVTEEASGRPVSELEVVFNVSEGPIEITPMTHETDQSAKNLSLRTDENGYAAVKLLGLDEADRYGVTATYDDMNFLSFPKTLKLGEDYFEEHPDPDSIELDLLDYVKDDSTTDSTESDSGNVDQIEEGTDTAGERATRVQCQMIERHLRHLDDHDVKLIRIDDHHPYTPKVLETLENLKEEDLLESITLSSLPRGEHQPKEDQLCGADLIYRQFIQDSEADNDGLEALCRATHLQDLHIEKDDMALQLSKLIGSRYSKIDMARGLMGIDSGNDYDSILEETGWEEEIIEYEQGLNQVLPRIDLTLHRLTFVVPPSGRNYENEVDWNPFQFPVKYFFGTEEEKQHLLRKQYAENSGQKVTILCALSPFCDPDKGEPQINVASAQNYLTDLYDEFDYFFYAYGSMLMSTRRVNENGYDIDLSKLVSTIGSPSDGGHAGAATGSPESNPNFPLERFEKVNDQNFAEYLYYISSYVEDFTGLKLHAIEETYPSQFEAGVRTKLEELEDQVYRLGLRGPNGVAKVLVANGVFTEADQGDVTVPLACEHINRTFPNADYVFYSVSTSNMVLRNLNDHRQVLDLDNIARILGTHQDGGHPRAASCKPKFNPNFPEDTFEYINYESIADYVHYLGDRILEETEFSSKDVHKENATRSKSRASGGT